jgi:hypothetical protein
MSTDLDSCADRDVGDGLVARRDTGPRVEREGCADMPASKPMARLGLLAVVALAGLSACATWPAYRVPQGAFGDSPDVMTSAPPGANAAANPDVAAAPSPVVPTIAPTISVPGPVVVNSTVQPRIDAESSGLAANAPPAIPEASQSTGVTLTEATAPASESNRDQLQPQKPLDATSPDSNPPSAGQQAAGGVVPGQTAPGAGSPAPAASATVTVAQPPGALARLRARFHNLIQPAPKPAKVAKDKKDKDGKSHDPAGTPHEPAQPVLTVHIPLPTSDESRVAKEDTRSPHGLFPAEEGPGPVSTAAVGVAQVGAPPAPPASQAEAAPSREVSEKPAVAGQIEQWPYSPQAVASAPKASSAPVPANEFDPIPVDEYQATVARVNGNANSLPSFHASQPTPNDTLHASASPATAAPPTAADTPPAASTPTTTELHVVPTVDAKPIVNEPALMRIDQAQAPRSAEEQGVSSARVDSQERPAPEQPPQLAQPSPPQTDATSSAGSPAPNAPAVQTSAALPVPAAPAPPVQTPVQTSVQKPIVRSAQWVGGRYGQPAWMTPYASPAAVPSGN